MVRLSSRNFNLAFRHPSLLLNYIMGVNESEISKNHVLLHLDSISKMAVPQTIGDPVQLISSLAASFANDCYTNAYLYFVSRLFKPQIFVETGVHHGVSSTFILKGLEGTAGRLYSIDLPNITYTRDNGNQYADLLPTSAQPGFVIPNNLKRNWTLRLGDSKVELPKLLEEIGPIDVFHHDSMHTYDFMTFELETAFSYLKPGGLLLSDDADWCSAFSDFCVRHNLRYHVGVHKGVAIKPLKNIKQ